MLYGCINSMVCYLNFLTCVDLFILMPCACCIVRTTILIIVPFYLTIYNTAEKLQCSEHKAVCLFFVFVELYGILLMKFILYILSWPILWQYIMIIILQRKYITFGYQKCWTSGDCNSQIGDNIAQGHGSSTPITLNSEVSC